MDQSNGRPSRQNLYISIILVFKTANSVDRCFPRLDTKLQLAPGICSPAPAIAYDYSPHHGLDPQFFLTQACNGDYFPAPKGAERNPPQ
jgi:hypothetical protein